jgi:hypothetical protein
MRPSTLALASAIAALPGCTPLADIARLPDGGHDASVPRDATTRDVRQPAVRDTGVPDVAYWQWWAPDCGAPGTACTSPGCTQVSLGASAVGGCSVGAQFETGCMPSDQGVDGWMTFTTTGDQVLSTLSPPATMAGLTQCTQPGQAPSSPYACCPWVPQGTRDAGADSAADSGAPPAGDGGAKDGGTPEGGGGPDGSVDASLDGVSPCIFTTLPPCVEACTCWLGVPASCFPPGSIYEYVGVDQSACTKYCPTSAGASGSYCAAGGRPDGGKNLIMGVDSGTTAWIYCRSDVCSP